ncbi:MAG: YbjN domain-containing protein [Vicingaceae bacterium]|nr:YbjN domain-containing protein [Vicingaceae bacterium]
MRLFYLLTFLIFLFSTNLSAQKMNNAKLEKILKQNSDSLNGNLRYWQFKHEQIWMLTVTDEKNNRMRIITPVVKVDELDKDILLQTLEANFHTALDVKYAISDGILWSVFLHPLKELTEDQVKSAIKQLYYSSLTFGTTFSGGELVFPAK